MRFTVLLTLCVLGVASASPLAKRGLSEDLKGFAEDLQSPQVQNVLKGIKDFSAQAKQNAEKALNKLKDFLKQANNDEAEIKVFEKRDLAENLQKLTGQAKENFEKNLKALMEFFQQFNKQPVQVEASVESAPVEAEAEVVVKRDTEEAGSDMHLGQKVTFADLVANVGNPKKFQDLLSNVLVNTLGGRNKREANPMEMFEKFLKDAQSKAMNAGTELQKAFEQFLAQFQKKTETEKTEEKTVEKREANPMEMFEKFLKDAQSKAMNAGAELQKAFEQFLSQFQKKTETEKTEEKTVEKREANPMEMFEKFLKDAQSKAMNAGAELQKAFEQFLAQFQKNQPTPTEASVESEKTVEKREANPMEMFEKFLKDAQSKAMNAGAELQKAFEQFLAQFQKKTETEKTEEKTVEKREANPMEQFEKFLKDAQAKAMNAGAELQKAFEQFLSQFQKKADASKEEVAAPAA